MRKKPVEEPNGPKVLSNLFFIVILKAESSSSIEIKLRNAS
jgi:hypothetical protein